MINDGIKVTADENISPAEVEKIVNEEKELWRQRGKKLASITLTIEGDHIISETAEKSPIKRLRRITGYLSNLDNFNAAKREEVEDRVSHIK